MDVKFYKEALFGGMTSNAFKLGTVLSMGWFWQRRFGCGVLYRGRAGEGVDFGQVLKVCEIDAASIEVPDWLDHEPDNTYYYVFRRINECGYEEQTKSAAVKVELDSDGELAGFKPNGVFDLWVQQQDSDEVQLTWFYSCLEQQSEPFIFEIYSNGGSGDIDYQNFVARIDYSMPGFYSQNIDGLGVGEYQFAVRAVNVGGDGDGSMARVGIAVRDGQVENIEIIGAISE